MPYEHSDVEFHQSLSIVGRISRWGSRVVGDPPRAEFDLLTPSQERCGTNRKMLCARISVFDPKNSFGPNDYIEARGIPQVKDNRLMLMCFGKDVTILNHWVSKKEKDEQA